MSDWITEFPVAIVADHGPLDLGWDYGKEAADDQQTATEQALWALQLAEAISAKGDGYAFGTETLPEPLIPGEPEVTRMDESHPELPRVQESFQLDDIVVTRSRVIHPQPMIDVWSGNTFSINTGQGFEMLVLDDRQFSLLNQAFDNMGATPDDHVPLVKVGLAPDHPDFEEALVAATNFQQLLNAMDPLIDSIAPNQLYNTGSPDGNMLLGSAIKEIWGSLSFTVNLDPTRPGYGGANVDGTVTMRLQTMTGYLALGDASTNHIILLELAHETPFGKSIRSLNFAANGNVDATYEGTNPHFLNQEAQTDALATLLGQQLGIMVP